jgi:hypothetical protein
MTNETTGLAPLSEIVAAFESPAEPQRSMILPFTDTMPVPDTAQWVG